MSNEINISKRNFLRGKQSTTVAEMRLPWVLSEQEFINNCTQCGDCLTACQENIIVKSKDGFPKVDLTITECTFCEDCIEVCEQPLFKKARSDKAWPSYLNIKDSCLTNKNVICLSCKDVCDPQAIQFVHRPNAVSTPVINQDDCTSCGACLSMCPTAAIEMVLSTR